MKANVNLMIARWSAVEVTQRDRWKACTEAALK